MVDETKFLLNQINKSLLSEFFYDPTQSQRYRIKLLNDDYKKLKAIFNLDETHSETIEIIKLINERSLSLLLESQTFFSFIKDYSNDCSEDFLNKIVTNNVLCKVIERFSWSSNHVKVKGMLACFLCDLNQSEDDQKSLRLWRKQYGVVSDKIKLLHHDLIRKLWSYKNLIPVESIEIVEQQHELPDGKGFPYGVTGKKFNQLSAIFIVSKKFTELLQDYNYDYEKRLIILEMMNKHFGSFKMFKNAIDALSEVVV